jgi:hypothetical protein
VATGRGDRKRGGAGRGGSPPTGRGDRRSGSPRGPGCRPMPWAWATRSPIRARPTAIQRKGIGVSRRWPRS